MDLEWRYTEQYRLSKFTAIEGRWQTEQPARLILLARPDPENERNLSEIKPSTHRSDRVSSG